MDTIIDVNEQDNSLALEKVADEIIAKSTAKASTIAALPIPLLDMAGVAYIQMSMVEKLANHYNVTSENKSKLIISSIITGMISKLTSEMISSLTASTNLDKILSEALIKASIAGFTTTITGEVFDKHFKSGGTLDDVNVDSFIEYIKDQFRSDRVSINSISNGIIDKALSEFGMSS